MLLWHITGFYGVWQMQQLRIRATMRSQADGEISQTLTIPVSELTWIEHGEEFLWKGAYYDVRHAQKTADGSAYILICVQDDWETELISLLKDITLRKMPTQNSNAAPTLAPYPLFFSAIVPLVADLHPIAPTQGESKAHLYVSSPYIGTAENPPQRA